jgi:Protein of unknown function (DUF2914)
MKALALLVTLAVASPAFADPTAEVKAGTGVENRAVVGVKHVWKRDGQEVWTATLKIGSKKWSTQSRRAIPKAGSWEVDVQTADGKSIGTVAFKVE